jgi:ADP-ribose pyrophosphatase
MDLTEKQLESSEIFDGRMLHLYVDTVSLPNGQQSTRELIRHPGAVVIVPVDEAGRVSLVRQFRYPAGKVLLELPAGKLEPGEDPLEAAQRELAEEVGARAERWTPLGSALPVAAYCSEVHHFFLARELSFGPTHFDEDEFLDPTSLPFDELFDMAADGLLEDEKTTVALLRARRFLEREG